MIDGWYYDYKISYQGQFVNSREIAENGMGNKVVIAFI